MDENTERAERQRIQNSRNKKIRRRAWEMLRLNHPTECLFKIAELDGRELARRYPQEFKELKTKSRIQIYQELGSIPGDAPFTNLNLLKRLEELEDRIRKLENKNDPAEWDDLEEL